MKNFLRIFIPTKYNLEFTIFITGAVILIYEILGSRILGPFLGTSIYVWTSLIGVILASLSIGYWLGGLYADKKSDYKTLSALLLFSALSIGLTILVKDIVLDLLSTTLSDLKWSAFFASIVLFSSTSILLGMVSPYIVKLKMKSISTSGTTVGNLYAISTVGSIAGTFLSGYFLIPIFGTTKILFTLSIILVITSILTYSHWLFKTKIVTLLFFIVAILFNNQINELYFKEGFIDIDTAYNKVWIYNYIDETTKKPARKMRINNENSSAMFIDNDDLVYEYTKYYRLAGHFKSDIRKALMLGGAGYSYPKEFIKNHPEAIIDVVEIDPKVTELAKTYFNLNHNPNLNIYHEDARTFLNQTKNNYDVIMCDVFKSNYSIPFHLATVEAIQKYFNLLNQNGVVIVNLISAINGEKGEFLRAEYATFKSVFPQVYLFPIQDPDNSLLPQNIILVALKSEKIPLFENNNPELNQYLKHQWKNKIITDMPILTDEYAPVEYYVSKVF